MFSRVLRIDDGSLIFQIKLEDNLLEMEEVFIYEVVFFEDKLENFLEFVESFLFLGFVLEEIENGLEF